MVVSALAIINIMNYITFNKKFYFTLNLKVFFMNLSGFHFS